MSASCAVHRRILVLTLWVCLAVPLALRAADAPAPGPDPAKLAEILGGSAGWSIVPPAYTLETINGQAVLQTKAGTVVTLTSSNRYSGPAEFVFTYRLDPQPNLPAGINCLVGCATRADKRPQSFGLSVSSSAGVEYLSYGTSVQPDNPHPMTGTLTLRAITDRSLAWPEIIRKNVEAANAAVPVVKDLRQTIRLVIADGKFTAFQNERFVNQVPLDKDVDPAGTITISLSHQVQLLSVRVTPLTVAAGRFEPLGLAGLFNASALVAGQKVTAKGLPGADQTDTLDGVAFRFAGPDAQGHDHLDLRPSWAPFGSLPGYFVAYGGALGGRWTSADKLDSTRFATYVPAGQYRALHLIAAADGEKDTVPVVSAQFFRPAAGHPVSFSGTVPLFSAKSGAAQSFPATLANGRKGQLHHVVIPLDPDQFAWFSDQPRIAMELTKAVEPYRAYPDPLEYSWHGAGLPSGVHIYAATLERAKVEVDSQPDQVGHVWTAPATPSYTIHLRNRTGAAAAAKLTITATSYDGKDTTAAQERTVTLPADGADVLVAVSLPVKRYGLHELKVICAVGGETHVYRRNLAFLHADTRERGNWAEGKGALFGYFGWGGGHDTPGPATDITAFGQAGAETSLGNYGTSKDPAVRALAEKYHLINEDAFEAYAMYNTAFSAAFTAEMPSKYHPEDPAGTGQALIEQLRKIKVAPGPLNVPTFLPFFPEPLVAERLPSGIWPHHYNAPEYQFTKTDEEIYQGYLTKFLIGARAVRKEWPNVKILFPYGDPMNTAIFLERSPETRELIDGIAIDIPGFERTPEQQINQVVLNRLYPILQDVKKYIKNPYLVMIEGPCVSSKDVDTTEEEKADIGIRNYLLLLGYGVLHHPSANSSFECAGWWGENHYGGGYCSRKPLAMPEIAYTAYATMTRHLNRANYTKYVPTGSTSVYCQQFKHYQTGALIHVLWTIRGTRPVTVKVPAGAKPVVYDENDNEMELHVAGDAVTFAINQSPCYLEGLPADAPITLGEPDHHDAAPAKLSVKLANLGNGSWKLVAQRDRQYEDTEHLQIERFLGNLSAQPVPAPVAQGGTALAVHLGPQEIDRRVMPYYTTFEPKSPVVIPGKASHLGLWVHASSDWGRVVYCLRDAKGERWISVGTKEEWNNDDVHCWSAFAFDGWRYLRFEVPASAPYDCFREIGTTWWGSYGGDGIVDLPLKLEKVIVERRSSVIYGADLVPAKPDDVLLGDLYAEYASAADISKEAVRLSKLRMPAPPGTPDLGNPIADLAKTGVGAPTKVLQVTDPQHQYDGTRCHVHFAPVAGAKSYDVWVSPYADGRGAMKLGAAWTESGKLIEGLRPDIEFHVFVVYTDPDGKPSKPSAPLRFVLKDRFGYK